MAGMSVGSGVSVGSGLTPLPGLSPGGGLAFEGFVRTPAAPVNIVPPVISGAAYVGNTVVVSSNGVWSGYPTPTFTYDWKIDGVSTGETGSSYVVQAADDTKDLTCDVTATNTEGFATEGSNTLVVGTQPVNTVAPVVSGNTYVGQVLSCTTGTWTGTATITYTYQWRRDGVNITGETATTYTLEVADVGSTIDCRVTGTNAYNSVAASSNSVGPITLLPTGNNLEWGSGNSLEWGSGNTLTWG